LTVCNLFFLSPVVDVFYVYLFTISAGLFAIVSPYMSFCLFAFLFACLPSCMSACPIVGSVWLTVCVSKSMPVLLFDHMCFCLCDLVHPISSVSACRNPGSPGRQLFSVRRHIDPIVMPSLFVAISALLYHKHPPKQLPRRRIFVSKIYGEKLFLKIHIFDSICSRTTQKKSRIEYFFGQTLSLATDHCRLQGMLRQWLAHGRPWGFGEGHRIVDRKGGIFRHPSKLPYRPIQWHEDS